MLAPPLQLPKNRSTGNLAMAGDTPEKARMRFSFDAGAAAAEYDALTRLVLDERPTLCFVSARRALFPSGPRLCHNTCSADRGLRCLL